MLGARARALGSRLRLPLGAAISASVLIATSGSKVEAQEPPNEAELDVDGVGGQIYSALINRKVNACPMAIRVAWHASGTYDEAEGTGGSNGGTMRYEPEHSDPANAGLFIIHDLLLQVKRAVPQLSFADLWTLAGCKAVEFMGGPRVPFAFGRHDESAATAKVPANGLLPDASQGADHLREVFGRMGFGMWPPSFSPDLGCAVPLSVRVRSLDLNACVASLAVCTQMTVTSWHSRARTPWGVATRCGVATTARGRDAHSSSITSTLST